MKREIWSDKKRNEMVSVAWKGFNNKDNNNDDDDNNNNNNNNNNKIVNEIN